MVQQMIPESAKLSKYHQEMVSRAREAIDAIFGDVSVDQTVIKSSLMDISKRIKEMQEVLASHS